MAVIRGTEKAAHDLFLSGLVKGTTHLAAGHEAVAVGASAALRPDDYVFATYRGHHHAIARGATPEECLAELMSRATGLCRAKGGSMHLTKADDGMLGSYAIVGAHLPMAAGAAWSARLRGTGQVAVAFFGDGATNIGAFHEALNLAAVWKLPVLFVCENNLYMEYTPIASVTAVRQPGRRPGRRATACPAMVVDGNDVVAVARGDGARPSTRARAGDGPDRASRRRPTGTTGTAAPTRRTYRPAEEVERVAGPRPAGSSRAAAAARAAACPTTDGRPRPTRARRDVGRRGVAGGEGGARRRSGEAFTDVWADGGAAWRT